MSGDIGQKHAVVLSGGAAHGAYHAGVLKALFEKKGIPATGDRALDPDIITGTSAGAFNATSLLAQIEAGNPNPAEFVEDAWLNRIARTGISCGSGVFRIRGNVARMLDPGCLLHPVRQMLDLVQDANYFAGEAVQRGRHFIASTERIEQRLLDQFNLSSFVAMDPFLHAIKESVRFEVLQRTDTSGRRRSIRIGAVRLDTGVLEYFERKDLTVDVGPNIVLASAAVPGIFPRVSVNGIPYADGGVIENTPLQGAIAEGADVVHVVTSFPKATNIPPDQAVNTLDTLWRIVVINVSASLNRDVERVRNINRGLKVLELLGTGPSPECVNELLQFTMNNIVGLPRTDQITVHVYNPPQSLGGLLDFLNFDREYLHELIRLGYYDTLSHNCRVNGCVLPVELGEGSCLPEE